MFFNSPLVAIDIGSSAIKMLELSGRAPTLKLRNFAIEAIPAGAIESGNVVDNDTVVSAIKALVKKMRVKHRRVSLAVSGSGVIVKKVRVTPGKDATIDEQMSFHAAQAFQLDLSDLYYDYSELGLINTGGTDVDVLLTGAKREIIEQYVSILKSADLKLGVIEAGALSIANMFELNYGQVEGLIAIISIGASHTQVSFINNGRYLYCHETPIGGETYTSAILQAASIPRDRAEAFKISAMNAKSEANADVGRAIHDTNQLLMAEIRQIFGFFSSSGDAEGTGPVKYVFLTGGACRTFGLDAAIATTVGVPVHFINPFHRVAINDRRFKIEDLMSMSPLFGVSVGLSTREKGDKVAI